MHEFCISKVDSNKCTSQGIAANRSSKGAAPSVMSLKDVISVTRSGERSSNPTNVDVSSSSDDIHARVRKPYTITKQREKWTEQEHLKFLEGLKLYGRSWYHIKEHIGTKTTVQIRSHAQKFFVKVERGISSDALDAELREIEIPPPRPKRKPRHPYPRKAGCSLPLVEKHEDTPPDYLSVVAPPVLCAPLHSNGAVLQTKPLLGSGLGLHKVGISKSVKPGSVKSDKQPLQNDPRSEETLYSKEVSLIQPQVSMHNEKEGIFKELSCPTNQVNTVLPNNCKAEVTVGDFESHPNFQDADVDINKQEGDKFDPIKVSPQDDEGTPLNLEAKVCDQSFKNNSNLAFMSHDSFMNYYRQHPTLESPQTAFPGPIHEHLAYPSSSWQFIQASFMNHPAAFAAAMAAAAWAIKGADSTSSYTCKGSNGNHLPSLEDLNAAFAAASASWWALSGLAQSHPATSPLSSGTCQHLQAQSAAGNANTPQQQVPAEQFPVENEITALPSTFPEAHKGEEKASAQWYTSAMALHNCHPGYHIICGIPNKAHNSTPEMTKKHVPPSAGGVEEGDLTGGEGSSSGSNIPALLSPTSEQDNPSFSENDNEDKNKGLNIHVVDRHKRAFQELGGDGCIKVKVRTSERGRPQQKESKHGEHESGKRLKSSIHETEARKEVSSQGRKAFEALFTCERLPQTFSREAERADDESNQEKAKPQMASLLLKYSNVTQAEVAAHQKPDGARECALTSEGSEHNSLSDRPRARVSGFIPYKQSAAKSRDGVYPARASLSLSGWK